VAELQLTRPAAAAPATTLEAAWQKVSSVLFDWEFIVTLLLALGAATAVSVPLEDGGWRKDMPPLTSVTVFAVIGGLLLARSRMSAIVAWPLGILTGAAVVGWQTLSMAGPGTLSDRLTNVYDRFGAWFDVVNSNQVTNDPLPFNVLIISLTWLGVLLFAWSLYRWHNAWIGLIPGGAALFLDLTLVGDNLTGAIVLYMLFGFLLVMQTNLLASIRQWRRAGADFPPMINLTFIHFSLWALVLLLVGAWVIPAGLKTPGPVESLAESGLEFASRYVRLAGPLQSNKVIPIHSYSGTLPFQGSIRLGSRELMEVTVSDPHIAGSLLLRGTTYDEYQGGGWQMNDRVSVEPPADQTSAIEGKLRQQPLLGTLVPLTIEMRAKTVAGTVVYVAGDPVATSRDIKVQVPASSIDERHPYLPDDGRIMSDAEVLEQTSNGNDVAIGVIRDNSDRVTAVQYVNLDDLGLLSDASALDPGGRIKRYESYSVTGFIPATTPDGLRDATTVGYPRWVTDEYLQLPDTPAIDKIQAKALEALSAYATDHPYPTNAYDKAAAVQQFLRKNYTYDANVPDAPPGADNVEYFLDNTLRGYFDYHASAMAVMLRTLGVPTRLAVGFAIDDTDRNSSGSYVVRDKNSYAWPEVYFPGYGWVPFNPTPDRSADLTPRTDASVTTGEDHDITKDVPAAVNGGPQAPAQGLLDPEPQTGTATGIAGSSQQPLKWYVSAAVTAFIAALIGAVVLGWNRSVSGLPYPQQVWEKTVRLAGWGGLRPAPGQTAHDYARRLGKRYRDVQADMTVLADGYTKSRFGHKELSPDELDAIKDAWPEVRANLVGGITSRFFRRRKNG
jgi:transglutaminase-like putative cysteine protease